MPSMAVVYNYYAKNTEKVTEDEIMTLNCGLYVFAKNKRAFAMYTSPI